MTKRVRTAAAAILALPLVLSGCTGSGDGDDVVTVTATASGTAAQPSPTVGEDAEVPEVPVAPDEPETVDTPAEIPDVDSTVDDGATAGGPQLGDACIGANIGVHSVDANGTDIICDNYSWQVDNGQSPTDPWVDGQIEWGNCIAQKTAEECRAELNG